MPQSNQLDRPPWYAVAVVAAVIVWAIIAIGDEQTRSDPAWQAHRPRVIHTPYRSPHIDPRDSAEDRRRNIAQTGIHDVQQPLPSRRVHADQLGIDPPTR